MQSGPIDFDSVPLRSLSSRIAEVVASHGPVREDQVRPMFSEATGIDIPKNRERLFGRFVWSARGRKFLKETENGSGVLARSNSDTSDNDAFGDETFGSIQELVEAVDPDRSTSFELLCDTVIQFLEDRGCKDSKLMRGTVGSAIWATGRRAARDS